MAFYLGIWQKFLNYIKESTTKTKLHKACCFSPQYSEEQILKNIREIDDLYNALPQQRDNSGGN
jgi:hypothetical protein